VCRLYDKDVYISKRALKHFVESRSGELFGWNDEYIINRLHFIIFNIENVLYKHDLFQTMNSRHYYSKDFSYMCMPIIRIVLEPVNNHFEIVTMHYKKIKNTTE